jgi:hypothetical protein
MRRVLQPLYEWYLSTKLHVILSAYLELVLVSLRIKKEDDLVKKRSKICDTCEAQKKIVGVRYCSLCWCPISAKKHSFSICDLDKWQD